MLRWRRQLLPLLAALLLLDGRARGEVAAPDDWPHIRGSRYDGHAPSKGLAPSWPEGGPPVLWTRGIRRGRGGRCPNLGAPTARSVPMTLPDDVEVQVFDQRGGRRLVGVVELVSPSNKDRPDSRRAFAGKCLAYLHRGIGVVVVDVVTERHGNLHRVLLELLDEDDATADLPATSFLYAVAYRPVHREAANWMDLWAVPLEVGGELPTLPLVLRGGVTLPVDLEGTYQEARERLQL